MDTKSQEEILLEKIESKVKSLTENITDGLMTEKTFNEKMAELKSEIESVKQTDVIEGLKKQLDDVSELAKNQGLEITKIKTMGKPNGEQPKTLMEAIKEMINSPEIKSYIDNGAKGASAQVKTLVDITQTTAITAGSTLPTQLLNGLPVHAPERKISMTDVISTGSTETDTVTFNEEYEFEDGVTTLTENQATDKSSFKVRPKSLTAGRIGTHLIVSKRSLKNEKYLISHIAKRLPQKIKRAEDQEILNGDGSGTSLIGLIENASVFSAGSFAAAILGAQEIDALYVAVSQLTQNEYQATAIILNPIDATKIELIKSTDEKYVDSMRAVRGLDGVLRIGGLPVVETTAMAAGKFLVGDMRMACDWLLFTPLTMTMSDSHDTLFLKNEVCINFEEEPVFPIYNPLMFVYGDFSVAIAAIDKAS